MNLQKILIADDKEENRAAARQAFPVADIVSSAKEAVEALDKSHYDLVITDMQMETPLSGLDVIRKAYEKNVLSYVLSHTGPSHTGETVSMKPYGGEMYPRIGKRDPQTWTEAFRRIQNPEGPHEHFHRAFERIQKSGKPLSLPEAVLTAMYYPRYKN